jgi:lysophospholipase L1-like esterase
VSVASKHIVFTIHIVLSALVALAALELCTRFDDLVSFGAPIWQSYSAENLFQYDSLGKRGRPNSSYKKWRLNSLGFRGPEVQKDRFRIICLGESETFGLYEQPGNEYPAQLERDLNRWAGRDVFQVIDAAIPGQTLVSTAQRVPEIIAQTKPQIAMIYPAPSYYIWLPKMRSGEQLGVVGKRSGFELRIADNFWNLLKEALAKLPRRVRIASYEIQINRQVAALNSPVMDRVPQENVDLFKRDLLGLVQALRASGVQPLLVTHATYFGDNYKTPDRLTLAEWRKIYPMLKETGFLDMENRMSAVMRDLATEQHIPLIDIAKEMPAGPKYFADMVHFTDEGASVMAAKLAEGLEPAIKSRGFSGLETAASTSPSVPKSGEASTVSADKIVHLAPPVGRADSPQNSQ